jgi:hypothetical protein
MNWKGNIEELKEKYWLGQTTLEEEKLLKEHGLGRDDEDIEDLYFQFLSEQKDVIYNPKRKASIIQIFRKNISAIAAAVALVIVSILVFNPPMKKSKPMVIEAKTPEEALLITQSAFAIIGDKINQSNAMVVKNMNQFDKILFFN